MSRYIDADKLMLDIRLDKRPTFRGAKIPPSVKETMFAYLDSAPHIDIVRCKECRHCLVGVATAQYSNGKQRIENLCEKHKWSVRADDYCSYGERKE